MENKTPMASGRLQSLDALRGFDMFWIMGGEGIFVALAALTGWPVLQWWASQLSHVEWHGFHFYDMIFPLFLFVAGISFPFSLAKRYHGEENRKALYRHVIRRGLTLVVLGIIYNNAIRFDFANLRYASVLGRIGLAWMFGALIFMNTKTAKSRLIWLGSILVGYWLLLRFAHPHIAGVDDPFSKEGNLDGFIDRLILPGSFCCYKFGDSEGIMSTIPAISTALLGMLTGQYIMSDFQANYPLKKVLFMVLAAIGLILLGLIWNYGFPINKYLWSSSFVCFVGGLSMLLFAVFYLVIDVWKFNRWITFFTVIGMNSITIYLAGRIINFHYSATFLFDGLIALFPSGWTEFLGATATFATAWIFLYILYKKKIFLKV